MLDENRVRQLINEAISRTSNDAQFGVVPVPVHAHTGIDSPQIDAGNLIGLKPPRITSTTSTATPTPNVGSTDIFDITAQTATATFQAPIGNPVNGQLLQIRITSSSTAAPRALSFATGAYLANSPALPSTTTTGKTSVLGFQYDTANSVNKWRLIWSTNS